MIIEVRDEGVFIPTWNGNAGLPEDEQVRVTHRYLYAGERKKYVHTEPIQLDVKTGEVDGKVNFVQDETGITRALVKKIENLSVKVGGKEVKITTAEQMYKYSLPQALVAEIKTAMLNASPEVDEDFLK